MSGPPPLPQTWLDLAENAKEEGNWASLRFAAMKILGANDSDPLGRRYLGIALCMQGFVQEGIEEHEKAIQLDSKNPSLWHDYGVTLIKVAGKIADPDRVLSFLVEAENKLKGSLRLDPGHYFSYRNLLSLGVGQIEGNWVSRLTEEELIDRCNNLVDQFFSVFGEEYPLTIELNLERTRHGETLTKEVVLEILRENGDVVVQNDPLRIYGIAQTFWEAYMEFHALFDDLYEEYVETSDELSPSGRAFAEQLRMRVEG